MRRGPEGRKLEFNSIPEAVKTMNDLLEIEGEKVFIHRIKKVTKEVVGIFFKTAIVGFTEFLTYRGAADDEISEAFIRARKALLEDPTARYAIGRPSLRPEGRNPPCLVSIQILLRDKPKIICYFRSSHLSEFPHDLARVADEAQKEFSGGEIMMFIGSFHMDKKKEGKSYESI